MYKKAAHTIFVQQKQTEEKTMLFSSNGKEKNRRKKDKQVQDVWDDFSNGVTDSDILGSYTGRPVDAVLPEQDADDL